MYCLLILFRLSKKWKEGAASSPSLKRGVSAAQNQMNSLLFESLYILVLAGFLGFEVIRKVPPLLHTPLMSTTNAISGISLVGSLVAAGSGQGTISTLLGTIAVTAATINVVGGFMITDRMLKMFRRKGGKPS
jgi:H+-translocating NAD(P) transhydrogenase subunit alpha